MPSKLVQVSLLGHLDQILFGDERTVSSGGSTVHAIRTAVPVGFWATSSGALSTSGAVFLGSHLDQSLLGSNKWAVSSGGSTVHAIGAAVPVGFWAASSGALGTSGAILLGGHLDQSLLGSNKWTISSGGS